MSKALFCTAVALAVVGSAAAAQDDTAVSGRAVDSATGAPLPAASVIATNVDTGETAAGALTDEDGRFVINGLPRGDYRVSVSEPGYESVDETLLVGELNDIYNLGDIALAPSPDGGVDQVTVVGQRLASGLSANLDRQTFRMSDNLAASAGSVLDAMRGLPGVTVDQEGRIQLRGSDRVAVLIDGRQSSLTGFGNQSGLDSIPVGNIEAIEIINNPSSRYDAAGMAGVVNIIYADSSEQGWSGDVGLTVGVGTLEKRKEDLPTDFGSFSNNMRYVPSLNLNYGTENTSYLLQAEVLVRDDLPNNEFTTRFYDDGRVILSQVPENREQVQYIVRGGIDRERANGDTLSLGAVIDFETHTDRAEVPFIDAATGERNRFWYWTESEDTGYVNVDASYERAFDDPGHTLSTSLQYTRGWEDETYRLNEVSSVRVGDDMTHVVATEHVVPFTVDYVRPTASGRIEAGLKLQARWIPVTYDVVRGTGSVIYPGLGDESEWSENTYAVYGNWVLDRERYSVEAGLRYELTEVRYDLPPENIYYPGSDSYSYADPYPNVRLTWKATDDDTVSVFFSNRVDRPDEAELRIFPKYDDPELLKVGNPYLRPQFTRSYEIAYRRGWDGGSVSAALFHRDIEDPFTRVFAIDPSNPNYDIVNRIYQNTGRATNTGLEVTGAQDLGDRLRLTGSVTWYKNTIDEYDTLLLFPFERPFHVEASEDTTWDARLGAQVDLPWGVEGQLSYVYYAPRNIAQGEELERSSFDFGLSKALLDDRVELTLSASDVFNDFGLRQTIDGVGFDAVYENYYQTQIVNLGLKYNF